MQIANDIEDNSKSKVYKVMYSKTKLNKALATIFIHFAISLVQFVHVKTISQRFHQKFQSQNLFTPS